ncbi:hypothetical protein FBZ92_13936 [Nitrospirillum viridazoti]|uniref:Uncharacterized protein n=1 Tax=Nitrospirillum amazonense TaxID=28077 RepID=A0A560HKJ7_9PROT|nr:hypothetical protein FBZ92_13936 [Nitrospirillum amazonense]
MATGKPSACPKFWGRTRDGSQSMGKDEPYPPNPLSASAQMTEAPPRPEHGGHRLTRPPVFSM